MLGKKISVNEDFIKIWDKLRDNKYKDFSEFKKEVQTLKNKIEKSLILKRSKKLKERLNLLLEMIALHENIPGNMEFISLVLLNKEKSNFGYVIDFKLIRELSNYDWIRKALEKSKMIFTYRGYGLYQNKGMINNLALISCAVYSFEEEKFIKTKECQNIEEFKKTFIEREDLNIL